MAQSRAQALPMRMIATARLVLEPQMAAHAAAMFDVLSDPSIYIFENEPPRSLEWLSQRYARLESRTSGDGSETWLNWVIRLHDGPLIGYVQATLAEARHASIAYELASAHWHQGLGSEAVAAMLAELAAAYGVDRCSAVLKRANLRSQRLLERLGFTPASRAAHDARQVPADEMLMELRRLR